MHEIVTVTHRTFVVPTPPAAVHAVLADVPDSAAHFPSVLSVVADQGGWRWTFEPLGAGPLTLQIVYASRYTSDPKALTVTWAPIPTVGNTRIEGAWRLRPEGAGTHVTLDYAATFLQPVPRLLRRPAKALVEGENARLLDGYIDNLKRTFSGGNGRLR